MTVVLLGAGASRAALGEQAPTSREFGRVFVQRDPSWPDRLPFLAGALRYLAAQDRHIAEDDWALDRVWNGIDENYKLAAFIANSDFQWPATVPPGRIYSVYRLRTWRAFWVLAGYEMRRAVNEIYGLGLESAIRLYLEAPGQLSTLLRALEPGDVVASMNYDLLADRILQAKWPRASNCRSEEDARTRTDQHGSLILKLHGSLDWDFMSHPAEGAWVERTPDREPISDRAIDYDAQGWEHRPLVVAPVRFKDDVLIPGIQPWVLVETLAFQWSRFVDALARADEFRVIGYSFPTDDAYGNRMIQEAVRRRRPGAMLAVHLHVLDDCLEVRNRLQEILPPKSLVECRGPLEN